MKMQYIVPDWPSGWYEWPCYVCKKPLNTTDPCTRLCQDCTKKMYRNLCKQLFPDCDLTDDPMDVYLFTKEIPILEQYYGPMSCDAHGNRVYWADIVGRQDHTGSVERTPLDPIDDKDIGTLNWQKKVKVLTE